MTSVWWQKCTRSGPRAWIRRSESRQAGRSLAWPDGSLSVAGSAYTRGVYAASPISRSKAPSPVRATALVTGGVAGGGDDLQAGQDLGVAVEQLEPGAGEVEPVAQLRGLAPGPVELGALDVERGVLEHGVLAAVVEVQVGVDDQADVGRAHVQLGQRVGDRAVDHAPVVQHVLRPADAGVDEDRAAGMGDHEPVHRPGAAVRALQAGQVQPLDLQRHDCPLTGRAGSGVLLVPRRRRPGRRRRSWPGSAARPG